MIFQRDGSTISSIVLGLRDLQEFGLGSRRSENSITLGFDKVKSGPKNHHEIRFRNFDNFDFNAFIADKDFNSFENILDISDPDSALQLWVQIFTSIFNKHAPYCTKRVKTR